MLGVLVSNYCDLKRKDGGKKRINQKQKLHKPKRNQNQSRN